MNEKHFMYLNSERLNSRLCYLENSHSTDDKLYSRMKVYDDYIDVKIPLHLVIESCMDDDVLICSYRVNIIDYLRDCGIIDNSIIDDNNIDKLVEIHRLKDEDAFKFREYVEKHHLDCYREIEFTELWIRGIRFDFHMDEFKRLNVIHRLCTKQSKYSVNETLTSCNDDSSTSLICDDEKFRTRVVKNSYGNIFLSSDEPWFSYRPRKEVFSRGKIKVKIPSIESNLDGTLTCDLLLPRDYISSCDIFLDMRLYFDCELF